VPKLFSALTGPEDQLDGFLAEMEALMRQERRGGKASTTAGAKQSVAAPMPEGQFKIERKAY